ncbi:hypothetical protein GCM10027418_25630 [Mariniluteicoccus endophyticus]
MGREDYAVSEVGTFGVPAQPAVAERMRPRLLRTRAGLALAVVSAASALGALMTFPVFDPATGWLPWLLFTATALMVAICAFQAWVWNEAMAEWEGRRDVNLAPYTMPSWYAHLGSFAVVAAGLVGALGVMRDAGTTAAVFWWALAALVTLVAAQVLGGIEYFRVAGAPGTLPAHFRRLHARQNPQLVVEPPADDAPTEE